MAYFREKPFLQEFLETLGAISPSTGFLEALLQRQGRVREEELATGRQLPEKR
ncbi:hypothetical protein [Paenibacillus macerans]|uniref:hypothetical protein n=1 Tax=Paenibacillus macerans TaxID=44252 RepID=UPI003D313CEE